MKFLVKLADLAPEQYDEVVQLLRRHGIAYRETPAGFLGSGALMVEEEQVEKAKALLREESRAFAREAREKWEREWRDEHGASTLRWLAGRVRKDPLGMLVYVLALVLMVGIFVLYPLWYFLTSRP